MEGIFSSMDRDYGIKVEDFELKAHPILNTSYVRLQAQIELQWGTPLVWI